MNLEPLVDHPAASPEELTEQSEQAHYLASAVAELPVRLRTVVEGSFFAERSIAALAEELGVSESRVSQMRTSALNLLRDALNHAFDPDRVTTADPRDGIAERRRQAYFAAVDAREAATRRPRPRVAS